MTILAQKVERSSVIGATFSRPHRDFRRRAVEGDISQTEQKPAMNQVYAPDGLARSIDRAGVSENHVSLIWKRCCARRRGAPVFVEMGERAVLERPLQEASPKMQARPSNCKHACG